VDERRIVELMDPQHQRRVNHALKITNVGS
jgi:hypothetical protein